MGDGGRRVVVHRIDPGCAVVDMRTADLDPYDPEDLARGPAGSLWVGDIGDNERRRDTVAVIVLPSRGEAVLHRLAYPDGPHDAEALLVDDAGRPIVITKEVGRPAGIYRTEVPPEGVGPTPLLRVGEVTLPVSDTSGGPIGSLGSRVVTGAAATADGRVVALRTYTDAWLYQVRGSDPAAALTGAPVRVPLPDEPQGEAIAFELDGTLLSGSESRGGVAGRINAVAGAAELITDGDPAARAPLPLVDPAAGQAPEGLPAAMGGAVAVALLLLIATALAIRGRGRHR